MILKKIGMLLAAVALVVLLFTLIGGRNNDRAIPVLASGRTNPASARKNLLVVTTPAYSGKFNPLYLESEADSAITRLLFDPLVEPDESGASVPVLADYTLSADGRTYTFTLKSAAFTNGDPVTAEDVAFTWHVLCDPAYKGHLDAQSLGIEGYEEYCNGSAATLSGVRVVDSHTIQVTLQKANSTALFVLGVAPLSKSHYGKEYEKGRLDHILLQLSDPIGCGQYSLTGLTMEQLTLDRCKEYYRGTLTVAQVQFLVKSPDEAASMLVEGSADLDLTGGCAALSIDGREHLTEQSYLSDSIGLLGFSCGSNTLADPVVRRAIALCIDRQLLIDQTFSLGDATPVMLPVSQNSWAASDTQQQSSANPDAAAALLEQAGYSKNADGIYAKDGVALSFTYTVTENNPASANLSAMLQLNLPKAGMKLSVRSLAYADLINQIKLGRSELWFMAWQAASEPDLGRLIASAGAYNLFGYHSAKADSLLQQSLAESSLEQRKAVYSLLWQELEVNPPFVSLYQRRHREVFNTRLQELSFNAHRPVTADFYLIQF